MRTYVNALVCLLVASSCALRAADLVFQDDSEWELVSEGHQFAEGMAWDKEGNFYFTDVPRSLLYKIDVKTGERVLIDDNTGRANGIAFGPDGRLYGCSRGASRIYAWNPDTWGKVAVAEGPGSNDIAILSSGTIFFTDPGTNSVWRIDGASRELTKAADTKWMPNGLTLSLDQKTLLVAEFNSGSIHGFPINAAGKLTGKSAVAYRLGMPSNGLGRLDGMQPLKDGRLISGTALGAQIAPSVGDEDSHALIVIPSPAGRPRCNYVRISPDGKWLYAAFAKDIQRRKLVAGFGS